MFLAMIGLWKLWPENRSLIPLFALALIVRVAAVFQFPHGDDIHRYLWEGKVQHYGFNPYKYAPKSKTISHLRDENYKEINHKRIPTIYWPFAQQLFKQYARFGQSITIMKSVFVLFDIGIIILLLLLLRHLALSYNHLLLYALNPFTIIYTAGEGHLEVVMVFWVVLALFCMHKKRFGLMYLFLGIALMTKVTPVILIPFIIRRENIRFIWMLFIPLLFAIPYLQEDISFLTVPLHFLEKFRYNGLVYSLVINIFDKQVSLQVCLIILFFLYTCIFFITPDPTRAVYLAIGCFLLCSPTFHPWYLLLITPFLVLYRSPPWIILHLSILPLVFVFNRFAPRPFWRDKTLMLYIEYIPFILVGIWYLFRWRRYWPVQFLSPKKVSIIIPVINEEKNIADCMQSVLNQSVEADTIVVDGGSRDSTAAIVQSTPHVRLIPSAPGRGIQIGKGISNAAGDIIMILHADSRLKPHALAQMLRVLELSPDASGGSFGAVYENHHPRFRFTELLNNFRAKFSGVSFGDQAQFFRRELMQDSFPEYKLMEDIELSMRLKEKGSVLFLSNGVISSTRMWKKAGYLKNFLKVIFLSSYYIIRRKFGLLTSDCSDFYRLYYGKE